MHQQILFSAYRKKKDRNQKINKYKFCYMIHSYMSRQSGYLYSEIMHRPTSLIRPPAISDAHLAGNPTNAGEPGKRGRHGREKGADFPLEIHLDGDTEQDTPFKISERGGSPRLRKRGSIGAAEHGSGRRRRWATARVVKRTAKRGWKRFEREIATSDLILHVAKCLFS